MNSYLFYTDEGATLSPSGRYVENCQLIGWEKGESSQDALNTLLQEAKWIKASGFCIEKIKSCLIAEKTREMELFCEQEQGIEFIWVTDGTGWRSTLRPLREYFDKADFLMNLEMLKNGCLDKIIKRF